MFAFMKKSVDLYAPVVGKSISLENVPDKVFANKLMGDGVAFEYEGDTIYAPCDGEVVMIASTNHAIGLKTKNGMEVLLHIGMDTVNLQGEGLEVLVRSHEKVKAKDKLIKIDRELMKKKGINLVTPLIVTNTSEYELEMQPCKEVTLESVVLYAKKK